MFLSMQNREELTRGFAERQTSFTHVGHFYINCTFVFPEVEELVQSSVGINVNVFVYLVVGFT